MSRIVAAAVLVAVLAGCSDMYYDRRETVSFAANDAAAAAQATQVIDPWPAASAERSHASSGAVVAGAIERYRTCQVVQPRPTTTQGTYNTGGQSAQPGCAPAAASGSGAPSSVLLAAPSTH